MMELMVVITIIVFGLLGVSSLVIQNLQAQSVNKEYLIASMLAQEGLELVRNQRDNNWLCQADWKDGENGPGSDTDIAQNDRTYIIDYRGFVFVNDTPDLVDLGSGPTRLYEDANGYYTTVSAGNTATPYYRLINITEDASDDFIGASSTVMWQNRGNTKTYQVDTILYDWR